MATKGSKTVKNKKKSAVTRKMKLGTAIRRFLERHNLYDRFDDRLLEQIDDIVEMMQLAKKSIIKDGIAFDVSKTKGKPYYHRNGNLTIWIDLKDLLNKTLNDNGLTVKQRKEIMQKLEHDKDDFDKVFD